MKKFLGQLIKEDIKSVLIWMILPVIVFLSGAFIYKATKIDALNFIVGIGIVLMSFGPLVSIAVISSNDYNRFYGQKAAFYTTIPIASEKLTLARLINFIIMGFIIQIIFMVEIFLFNSRMSQLDIKQLFEFFSIFDTSMIISMIKFGVIAILMGMIFALNIMMASSIGSSKPINRMGSKLAPGFVFIVILVLQSLYFNKYIIYLSNLIKVNEIKKQYNSITISMIDLDFMSFSIIFISLLAVVIGYFYITNYFHKRKISVK